MSSLKKKIICLFLTIGLTIFFLGFIQVFSKEPNINLNKNMTYEQFYTCLLNNYISEINKIDNTKYEIYLINDNAKYTLTTEENIKPIISTQNIKFNNIAERNKILPLIIIGLVIMGCVVVFVFKQNNTNQKNNKLSATNPKIKNNEIIKTIKKQSQKISFISSKKIKIITDINITFNDIAGITEAKDNLSEIIDFLKNNEKYMLIGAKLPKGVLLIGPPGTGKTLLAKAIAGESGVPLLTVNAPTLIDKTVTESVNNIKELFDTAKSNCPCIIFIDEVDAIGKCRSLAIEPNDIREQILNQLLIEMDSFDSSSGILVVAATSRYNILDESLLRTGRFDRKVILNKPDFQERIEILDLYSDLIKIDEEVDIEEIAHATAGCVGSDLASIMNESAIRAIKNNREIVSQEDILESIEVLFAGQERKNNLLSEEEKLTVAVHEVGHALLTSIENKFSTIQRITIIPRTIGLLGYTVQNNSEKYLTTKEDILSNIKILLAGRCAEEVILDKITSGATNDIKTVTELAHEMVAKFGMSEAVGIVNVDRNEQSFPISETIATKIDFEVKNIINKCYDEIKVIIEENKNAILNIAHVLVQNETLFGDEFIEMLNDNNINTVSQNTNKSNEPKKKDQVKKDSPKKPNIEEKKSVVDEAPPIPDDDIPIPDEIPSPGFGNDIEIVSIPIEEDEPEPPKIEDPFDDLISTSNTPKQKQPITTKKQSSAPSATAKIYDNLLNNVDNKEKLEEDNKNVTEMFNKKSKGKKKTSSSKTINSQKEKNIEKLKKEIEDDDVSTSKKNATELTEDDY